MSNISEQFKQTRRVKRGWMNLKVQQVIEETHDTKTFILVDAEDGGRAFDYLAGQYLTFRYDGIAEKPLARSYTMSSSPSQRDFCAVTVKRVEGGLVSNWMCDQLQEGSVIRGRGPIGKFCYMSGEDQPWLVMVAGGSGVTPFVSMIREYAPRLGLEGYPKGMVLLVAHRSREDLICQKDLDAFAAVDNCRIVTTLTREHAEDQGFLYGRPDEAMLDQLCEGIWSQATIMTCGPVPMMNMVVAHAHSRGLAHERVKFESFES